MDTRSSTLLTPLHPVLVGKFIALASQFADATGDTLEVVQGLRSWAAQAALYAQGRTAPGEIVTNAQPGYSWHEFGLALDCAPASLLGQPNWDPASPYWRTLVSLAQIAGFNCGACWTHPDVPHLQITGRFPVTPDDEARQLFLSGGLKAVWDAALPEGMTQVSS